jgi:hypothetical protein
VLPATTAANGVMGVAGLFVVLFVGSFGAEVVALNGGFVPTVLAKGVTGILITAVLLGDKLLIGPGVEQVTVCPEVVQELPLLKKLAGAVVPVGKVNVVVIGPVAGAEPTFVIVTGILLGSPTVSGVVGWPILVIKSGTPAIGVEGVIGLAPLLPVLATGSLGAEVVALNCGLVPADEGNGVTGTLMTDVFVGAVLLIGPGVEHVTVCPNVVQELPLLKKLAGAVVPVGMVIVVVIGPVAGAVPTLVIVTGISLDCPTVRGVVGCPIVVTKSGAVVTETGQAALIL